MVCIPIFEKLNRKTEPLSSIIKRKIVEYIKEQNLQINDRLPSEAELAKLLGVSRTSVREAYAQLVHEGIVYRIQGKGTFLRRNPIRLQSGIEVLLGVTDIIKSFNYKPSTEFLKIEVELPDEETRENLRISGDDHVVTYYRKRYADNTFAVYSISRAPIKFFKDGIPRSFPEESMLNYFEKHLGFEIESAIAEILPTTLDRETSKRLSIPENILFILLKQTIFDSFGTPLIYSLDYFNSEIFKFTIVRRRHRTT